MSDEEHRDGAPEFQENMMLNRQELTEHFLFEA
jgi:hypothetical protein